MELRHLRYFVAVAEELHFGRAAARLHMAQPPLSQQIKALENEVGASLFHRTRRHVELTDAGRALLPEARATIEQARRAESVVRDVAAGRKGRLAVAFVTSASYSVLPDAVHRFRSAFPDVELTLQQMIPSAQIEALERREVDVGLLRPPVAVPGLTCETIFEEPLVVALPAQHPLASQPVIALERLREADWVLFPQRHGPGLYDLIAAAFRSAGFTPVVRHEPNDMQSILAHVAAGLGVSIVPGSLMGFHPGQIAYRRLRKGADCLQLILASPASRASLLTRAFRDACRVAGASCRARLDRATRAGQPSPGNKARHPKPSRPGKTG